MEGPQPPNTIVPVDVSPKILSLYWLIGSARVNIRIEHREAFEQQQNASSFMQIQELYFIQFDEDLLEYAWLIRHCPRLRRLTWFTGRSIQHQQPDHLKMKALSNWIRAAGASCQNLEEIGLPYSRFENKDWDRLLSSIRLLSCLDLNVSTFNEESWKILQAYPRHLTTLRGLDLRRCCLPGTATHAMMCEMPNLEVFRTCNTLSTLDLQEDPRPWICMGLKELALTFMVVPDGIVKKESSFDDYLGDSKIVKAPSDSQRENEDIFHRIAGLRSLEVLSAFALLDFGRDEIRQELKVPGQLDQWQGTLKRLRKLGPQVRRIRAEDTQWFLEHWPQIEIDYQCYWSD
ncbi:hypothetical protein EMPS_01985 [Entomortierella parvispora]|uniref:Uncharacterized protein n=1 Tax=Entomortierella parvispora TaxID=205924 RepID=A0A9P3LTB3_9FUNG|nr:hypothetical protein EMPS_01985 [Entomortierella parvispora]